MSAVPVMDENPSATPRPAKLRIWDGPTRVMHWLLVVFIAACWWTGIHDQLQYHLYAGYAVLWIVLMRLYWGVVGSSTARFAHFVRGPAHMLDYARTLHRRDTTHSYGHNPLGAISVLVMLGVVLAVVVLGLFAVDVDGLYRGRSPAMSASSLGVTSPICTTDGSSICWQSSPYIWRRWRSIMCIRGRTSYSP